MIDARTDVVGSLLRPSDLLEARAAGPRRAGSLPVQARRMPLAVGSPLRRGRFLCAEEFAYARWKTDRVLNVPLPSPSVFANFWDPDRSTSAYGGLEDSSAPSPRSCARRSTSSSASAQRTSSSTRLAIRCPSIRRVRNALTVEDQWAKLATIAETAVRAPG